MNLFAFSMLLIEDNSISSWYRVFIKYCVFFQELSIFCDLSFASTGLLLAVQKWATNKSVH